MSQDIDIQAAITETILGASITPKTTLSADYTPNTAYIDVADASRFTKGGVVTFWDATGEAVQAIASITGNRITLKLRPGQTGLAYAHTAGATVGTNLTSEAPVTIGPMLAKGDPMVFCYANRASTGLQVEQGVMKSFTIRVQIHRSIQQTQDAQLDSNLWAIDQQAANRRDQEAIEFALLANWHLNASNGPNAQGLGDGTRPVISEVWEPQVVDADIPQAIAAFEITVRARTHSIRSR